MRTLFIVGIGMGNENLLTVEAMQTIKNAKVVVGTKRIIETIRHLNVASKILPYGETVEYLEKQQEDSLALLVSGDVSFYSLSKLIVEKLKDKYEIRLINGLSSLQYFSSRLGVPYDDMLVASIHGRDKNFIGKVSYNPKVFLLTGGRYRVRNVCELLDDAGLGFVNVTVGECLGSDREKMISSTATGMKNMIFDDLAVMLIENEQFACPHTIFRDEDFIREKVPMTKAEVRQISLYKLGISPTDTVYDIGCGTGSVSVEMAYKAYDGQVFAIDKNEEALALTAKNRIKHRAYNIEIVKGEAIEAVEQLSPPDAVFIGGSSGNINIILGKILQKNPKVRVVINVIALQSLSKALESIEQLGFINVDIALVTIAKAKRVKEYDLMIGNNPVYIISCQGKGMENA